MSEVFTSVFHLLLEFLQDWKRFLHENMRLIGILKRFKTGNMRQLQRGRFLKRGSNIMWNRTHPALFPSKNQGQRQAKNQWKKHLSASYRMPWNLIYLTRTGIGGSSMTTFAIFEIAIRDMVLALVFTASHPEILGKVKVQKYLELSRRGEVFHSYWENKFWNKRKEKSPQYPNQ